MWYDMIKMAFVAKSIAGLTAAFDFATEGKLLVAACLCGIAAASPIWKLTERMVERP